jgi:hypothetical protein
MKGARTRRDGIMANRQTRGRSPSSDSIEFFETPKQQCEQITIRNYNRLPGLDCRTLVKQNFTQSPVDWDWSVYDNRFPQWTTLMEPILWVRVPRLAIFPTDWHRYK